MNTTHRRRLVATRTKDAQAILNSCTNWAFQDELVAAFSAIDEIDNLHFGTTTGREHLTIFARHQDQTFNECFFVLTSDLQKKSFDASAMISELLSLYHEYKQKDRQSWRVVYSARD